MMKLYVTPGSPYARMARIVVLEKGLESRVETIVAKTRAADSPYYAVNPSGRVPYLVREDGVGLEESALVCAWLDRVDGKPADPPSYGGRLYQRVTLAFDPQKKEGVPMLISTDGPSNLYRFTNANTGEVHEVWVRKNDASLARVRIGKSVEMQFEP